MNPFKAFLFLVLNLILFTTINAQSNTVPEVKGWYFRAVSGYPISVTFEPVVLFKNGTYLEATEAPLEEINFSESKKNDANLWGTWKRNDDLFTLTNHEGKSREYNLDSGNWFPAFPFDRSITLKGTYEKISGGNFGNGLYSLFKSEIVFLDSSHFTQAKESGITSYGSSAWKNSKDSGTYSIDKNTITFTYNDGRTMRLSFAIGAEGDNVINTDMIFIGGKTYVIE
ncbi:hypothetical protein KIM67_15490 [Flagellimonas sp. 389]|uniref:hypothetical protein n=1 Tax=Flagellimonas sp. 389 TaxID=2835862 RepID=UPI001BD30BD4|nr:hypothetical protein [Flagellimonas sp. 389]MBS9463823.1 hypothetical protein [Flagellimonas sp. 389]